MHGLLLETFLGHPIHTLRWTRPGLGMLWAFPQSWERGGVMLPRWKMLLTTAGPLHLFSPCTSPVQSLHRTDSRSTEEEIESHRAPGQA